MKRMVVDTANILFRVAAAHGKYNKPADGEESAGLAMHIALQSLNKFYKKFKPDQIALTFEGSQNWRKEYTRSKDCISKKIYKANRVKDPSMEIFFELIKNFEDLARNHTTLVCLSHPKLEGDDLFAGYVQRFAQEGDEVIGISGDKDFVQLLKHKSFSLIDADKGKPRQTVDVCGVDDPEFFIFEKAFRGDRTDNVLPAYPRILKKKLLKCMSDEYEMVKLMNETWSVTDPETMSETTYRVGDLFEENNLLMNLERQPEYIRNLISDTITDAIDKRGKFSHFHFTKFCGKYGLNQIAENASQFAEMFSTTIEKSKAKSEKSAILVF